MAYTPYKHTISSHTRECAGHVWQWWTCDDTGRGFWFTQTERHDVRYYPDQQITQWSQWGYGDWTRCETPAEFQALVAP